MTSTAESKPQIKKRDSVLLGVGNPLLDISAFCDEGILTRYNIKANDAILAEDTHMPLYDELILQYEVEYTAGGATQNSMRVAQWILGEPNSCSIMGCVGNDGNAATLKAKAEEAGVNVKYQYNAEHGTGVCAVIITKNGTCRSLVTDLKAANKFTRSHLDVQENKELIQKAKYFYISGFFLTVSIESILEVGAHACEANKIFAMNLSAEFLCVYFSEQMMKAFPYVDILFGNETEAAKFAEVQKLGTNNIREIAIKAASLPKANKNRSRTIVFTQGADNIIVARDGVVTEYPATRLPEEKITDTNGAGDAFVGGFLAQLVRNSPLEERIRCAIWTATQIIQQSGCTCPTGVTYPALIQDNTAES